MLTEEVMCPNCRYRFPAPGCCVAENVQKMHPSGCYYGGLLVPRGYTSGGGCFINAPTIIHGSAIIQTGGQQGGSTRIIASGAGDASKSQVHAEKILENIFNRSQKAQNDCQDGPASPTVGKSAGELRRMQNVGYEVPTECHVTTTCDLTGGSVTITTPSIQSGGCLIQSIDSGIVVQAPQIEIRPKLSGGGCLVQKRLSSEDQVAGPVLMEEEEEEDEEGTEARYADRLNLMSSSCNVMKYQPHKMLLVPPSGCEELPGIRRSLPSRVEDENRRMETSEARKIHQNSLNETGDARIPSFDVTSSPELHVHARVYGRENQRSRQHVNEHWDSCQQQVAPPGSLRKNNCHCSKEKADGSSACDNRESNVDSNSVQIQVNVTVPANVGQCTVNITATTNSFASGGPNTGRSRNNFNGGGLVQAEGNGGMSNQEGSSSSNINSNSNNERRDGTPTTPVSWLMPCPWGFESFLMDKEVAKLCEVKRLLQICGWYHEGLSWQQSENLLKDAPVGRWLMRDSSDSRYTFAVSVQTIRGPTSVRVRYCLGQFRLDAEPQLTVMMPHFSCPIQMLEYYVEYSKRMDGHRREVWVDYSGEIYSPIYLTKPLVKEVRSLSHLARLAVNKNKLSTENLPPVIKNYLMEYPYTL